MSDKLCRGCGGTGLDHHLSARELQFARLPFYMKREMSAMSLRVADHEQRGRLHYEGPLALVLAEVDRRRSDGFELVPAASVAFAQADAAPSPPKCEWACRWCHGTGKPALSVATLEIAVRGGGS